VKSKDIGELLQYLDTECYCTIAYNTSLCCDGSVLLAEGRTRRLLFCYRMLLIVVMEYHIC